ncbi:hypothetical protein BDK51DRAFT_26504 [Blyttiomyces helicus]|uniref:Uncharacterized protein n=1 Tax=Blyttiomyces helicus TaxID=388810 RepID=A0A4P9W3C3_9FUNG|nr:hypothetical protein BDK51DRAFT_26504 [Blyttiomyces helicus]|eukprot:RKO86809.1 hypothetical protein BDK51DRAFT_26504 [Blyttiomyces helicus]
MSTLGTMTHLARTTGMLITVHRVKFYDCWSKTCKASSAGRSDFSADFKSNPAFQQAVANTVQATASSPNSASDITMKDEFPGMKYDPQGLNGFITCMDGYSRMAEEKGANQDFFVRLKLGRLQMKGSLKVEQYTASFNDSFDDLPSTSLGHSPLQTPPRSSERSHEVGTAGSHILPISRVGDISKTAHFADNYDQGPNTSPKRRLRRTPRSMSYTQTLDIDATATSSDCAPHPPKYPCTICNKCDHSSYLCPHLLTGKIGSVTSSLGSGIAGRSNNRPQQPQKTAMLSHSEDNNEMRDVKLEGDN